MSAIAYVCVVFGILIAKCFGFLRDIVFASVFGATEYTDIYFQVFGIASLVFTSIGGALSTLLIKNLNKSENCLPEKQKEYVAWFITRTSVVMIFVTAVLYLLSGVIVKIILPGLREELFSTAVKFMYIMLPSCLFVTVAYIISGVLQNSKVFFISSIMSLPFNAVIIMSLFADDVSLTTVGIVTTIGWFLHIVIQLPAFYKKGYRLFSLKKGDGLKKGRNTEVLYIFISSMMFQLCLMVDKAFVSYDSGAVTTINYASNLFVTVASVFVVAMSNVAYPSICRNYEAKNMEFVRQLIRYIITVLFAIFIPFILTVGCFGEDIIRLVYERGEFTGELTKTTATLFTLYVAGIFGYVCQELFNKVLYLANGYKYTVIGTVCVVLLNPVINLMVAESGGAVAVAAATAVLFNLYAIAIAVSMARVTGNYVNKSLAVNLIKILGAGALAFAAFILLKIFVPSVFLSKIGFIIPLAVCGIIYVGVLFVSGIAGVIFQKRSDGAGENE